jgi:E3 ubiquitin-protein ligase HUWE1
VDFDVKRAHIQLKLKKEKEKYVSRGTSKLKIRRSHLLEDSYNQLRARTHEEMKGRMQIVFAGEEGIDAGGLTREWYQILAREIFNPDWGLFQLAPSGEACYEPNKHSSINPEHLRYFHFVGRLIGKALYDGVLLDAYFTRPIYKHLLGQPLTFEDMEGVDPDYYKNIKWMLDNDIEGVLDLNFSDTQNFFGETKTVDLIKNGRNVSVTNVNKLDYVNLITAFRMTDAVKDQLEAFIEGFTKVVDRDVIGVLNASELELLISGTPDIDLDDLKVNTEYHGGYTATSPQIRWFWEIVREMNVEDRARLLMFCTGTSKVPLDGFEKLRGMSGLQKFQIHKAQANDPNQLCTAHTCFNQLDLIAYDTKEELKERLLYSIREGSQGFGFA